MTKVNTPNRIATIPRRTNVHQFPIKTTMRSPLRVCSAGTPARSKRTHERFSRELNAPRLALFELVQRDFQHAVLKPRLHVRFIDVRREREAADKAFDPPLVQEIVRTL